MPLTAVPHAAARRFVLFCMVLCLSLAGIQHARMGIDLTDEGMYVSSAFRFSLGDAPIADEAMSVLTQFGWILSVLFELFPDITLLQIRIAGLALHLGSLLCLYLYLSRFAPPLVVGLSCAIMFFSNNYLGMLTPSYNLLSSTFLLASLVAWLASLDAQRTAARTVLAILSGLLLFLAVVSYLTVAVMLVVPGMVWLAALWHRDRATTARSSLILVCSAVICTAGYLVLLVRSPRWADMADNFRLLLGTAQSFNGTPGVKFMMLAGSFARSLPYAAASLAVLAAVVRFARAGGVARMVSALIIPGGAAILYATKLSSSTYAFNAYIVSLTVLGVCAAVFLEHRERGYDDGPWAGVRTIALAWGLISSFLFGFSSGNGILVSVQGIAPLGVIAAIAAWRSEERRDARSTGSLASFPGPTRAVVMTALITLLACSFFNFHRTVYRYERVEQLTTPFTHPKLQGLFSTNEKVRVLEEVLRYLDRRVRPGDYFLAFNYIPMMYYLTSTRPAYGAVWARDDWSVELQQKLLNRMIEGGRLPEYCLRMRNWPVGPVWNDPMPYAEGSVLNTFVQRQYRIEAEIPPFEIWRRLPDPPRGVPRPGA